jgi:hypothetical protein
VPESRDHLELVQTIVSYVTSAWKTCAAMAILTDLPARPAASRPPRIAGYVPDVYAADVPTTQVIIGEAKTLDDLETEHARRQLWAFLEFLEQQKCGTLIVAVPWQARATAHNMTKRMGASKTRVIILDHVKR